jgi:adenylate cyclase
MKRPPWWWAPAIGLGIAFLFGWIARLPFADNVEWRLFDDWMQRHAEPRRLAEEVAFVTIDDQSLSLVAGRGEWGWNWPWDRKAHSWLIASLVAAGAKEIRFDILFPEPGDPESDDLVAAAAEAAGNVSFARTKDVPSIFQPTFLAELSDDESGTIRREVNGDRLMWWPASFAQAASFVSAIDMLHAGKELLDQYLPKVADRYEPALLREAFEKMRNHPPPEADRLRGKTVFVAATAAATYDLKVTPVGPREPGVMLHATKLWNEKHHAFFRESPWWGRDLLILACALLPAWAVLRLPRLAAQLAAGGGVLAVVLGVSYVLFLRHIWLPPVVAVAGGIVALGCACTALYIHESRQKRYIVDLFGNFVSKTAVSRFLADPSRLKLGGHKVEATVLFSDLSGFTQLSEKMPAEQLVDVLNEYLTEMSEYVIETEGYLDKYIGDAIMAVWGDPDWHVDHAARACITALRSQQRLAEMIPDIRARFGVTLKARIGINSGEMVSGVMGSPRKRNYTAIGDNVNLASRLEGANKPYGTLIMISEATRAAAADVIETRPIDLLAPAGKSEPVLVHELLARKGQLDPMRDEARRRFTEAFDHYRARRWSQARQLILTARDQLGGRDGLSDFYLARLDRLEADPPPADWDGVFRLDSK